MAEIFTEEKIIRLKEARDKAMESDTPFPIVKDGQMAVVGDANKTEIQKHNFILSFGIPDENGVYQVKNVEYEDVWIKPRHAVTVQRLMTALQPLYIKQEETGPFTELSPEEMLDVAVMYEGDVLDQIYRLVAVVLGVDERIADFIMPDSALLAYEKIMVLYSDMAKASDSFFGLLPNEKATPSNNG